MTPKQRIELRIAEINEQRGGGMPSAESAKLETELRDLREQLKAAEAAETTDLDNRMGGDRMPVEIREAMQITRRADVGTMFNALVERRSFPVGSAETEAQAVWRIEENEIPLPSLVEMRVIDAPDNGGGTSPILQYVFGDSIAAFCNINRPVVPGGEYVYPSFSTGAAATRPVASAENADQDPTMRGQLLSPKRVQANTSITVEDRMRFPNLGTAVTEHLRRAVTAGLDRQAVSDDGGFFDATSGPLGAAPTAAAASTYQNYLAMVSGNVDGQFAANLAQVGLLIGTDTFTDAMALDGTNNDESVIERIGRVARYRVSPAVPAPASNVQYVLAVKGGNQAAVQPTWPGLRIEDIYSRSAHGEIKFTVSVGAAFSVQQIAAYDWLAANVS